MTKNQRWAVYKQRWRKKRQASLSPEQREAELLERRIYAATKQRKLKAEAFKKLGEKCNSPDCQWRNADGTFGCRDPLILQVDHVNGGGRKEHRSINHNAIYRKVIADTCGNYQLLCANCNWLKRYTKKETPFRNIPAA